MRPTIQYGHSPLKSVLRWCWLTASQVKDCLGPYLAAPPPIFELCTRMILRRDGNRIWFPSVFRMIIT